MLGCTSILYRAQSTGRGIAFNARNGDLAQCESWCSQDRRCVGFAKRGDHGPSAPSPCLLRQDGSGTHAALPTGLMMYVKTCLPVHAVALAKDAVDNPSANRKVIPTDSAKWEAAVLDPVSGRVYGIPGDDLRVIVYDPKTGKVDFISKLGYLASAA